ncbi:MAG TPA: ATP-dependent Clp protease ATP-binding subunit, partial [Bacteroidia bacterium]|nr:ATP-dependent Clp protease ATP-binding subunit [Bacteroidia bacterium]
IGARQLKDFGTGVGFGTAARTDAQDDAAKGVIENALKKAFAPEFLNRIDDVIMFNSLVREDIHKIIDIELANLFGRVTGLGYTIKISDAAKDYIVEKGFDPNYGARPLKRAIQKYLEDPMAEEIIKSNLSEGDEIEVDYNKEKDEIIVSAHKPKGKKSKKEDKS